MTNEPTPAQIAWQLARMDMGAADRDARAALIAADESAPTVERLAAAFASHLFGELGAAAMGEIRAANVGSLPGACASHDHCDANLIMADAFADIMGRAFLPGNDRAPSDADCALWSDAWQRATRDYLTD